MSGRDAALSPPALAPAEGSRIGQRLAPLFAAAPDADRPWLRRLLLDPDSLRACSSIETELYMIEKQARGSLLFTSAERHEGRTTFALLFAALSCALDVQRRVLLVDADLDHGRLGALLGLPEGSAGLAEVFDDAPHAGSIHPTALPNLWITPLSGRGHNAVTLSPRSFAQFMDDARARFDLVVVDSPAGGLSNAVLPLAKVVHNTIVVIRYGGPTREQISALLADLERAGAAVLGSVLNQREYVVPAALYGLG